MPISERFPPGPARPGARVRRHVLRFLFPWVLLAAEGSPSATTSTQEDATAATAGAHIALRR